MSQAKFHLPGFFKFTCAVVTKVLWLCSACVCSVPHLGFVKQLCVLQ